MKSFKQFINEDYEQIDELSKKTLRSYISKATKEREKQSTPTELKRKRQRGIVNAQWMRSMKEDGMGGGAIAAGPTNVVGSGAIAGSGGKGGEPGVHLPRKKKDPVMGYLKRKSPKL